MMLCLTYEASSFCIVEAVIEALNVVHQPSTLDLYTPMLGCTKCTVKFRVLCRFVHSVLVKLVIRRKQIKISFVHKIALPYMYMYLFGHNA